MEMSKKHSSKPSDGDGDHKDNKGNSHMLAMIILGVSGGILSAILGYDGGLTTIVLGYVGGGLFSTIAVGFLALPQIRRW